jgi:hypothetical protein
LPEKLPLDPTLQLVPGLEPRRAGFDGCNSTIDLGCPGRLPMRITGEIKARKYLCGELGAGVYIQAEGFGENSFGGLGHGCDTTADDAREQEREPARFARDRLARPDDVSAAR